MTNKNSKYFKNSINKFLLGALLLCIVVIAYLLGRDQNLFLGSKSQMQSTPTIVYPTSTPVPSPTPTVAPAPIKIFYPSATPIPPTVMPTVDESQKYVTIGGYNGEILTCRKEGEMAIRDVVNRLSVDYQTMAQCLLNNRGIEVCSTITAPNRGVYAQLKYRYCKF